MFTCPKFWADTLELEVWCPLDTRTFNFVLRTTLTWVKCVFPFSFIKPMTWRRNCSTHIHFLPSLSLSIVFQSISYLSNAYFRWELKKWFRPPNFILCICGFLLLSLAIALYFLRSEKKVPFQKKLIYTFNRHFGQIMNKRWIVHFSFLFLPYFLQFLLNVPWI